MHKEVVRVVMVKREKGQTEVTKSKRY